MTLWECLRGYAGARRTVWVTAGGRQLRIGSMSRAHLVNALAMIMNKPYDLDEPNIVWRNTGNRGLRWSWPDNVVRELTDRRRDYFRAPNRRRGAERRKEDIGGLRVRSVVDRRFLTRRDEMARDRRVYTK